MKSIFSKTNLPLFAIAIACLVWGAGSPIFKWSLTNVPTFTLAYFRFAIASLILFPFVTKKLFIAKTDLPRLFLIAVLGISINIIFFFWGLQLTSSISTSIIIALEPIFILLASLIFLGEKPHKNIWLGIIISLIGFIVVIIKTLINGDKSSSLLGELFIIIAVISYAGQTIFTKELSQKYEAVTLTFWSFIIGTLTFLPLMVSEALKPNWLIDLSFNGIFGILYGAIGSSALAYFLYNWGIKHVQVSKTAVLNYLNTISGVIVAVILLHEQITPPFLLGSILIFAGVYITEKRK